MNQEIEKAIEGGNIDTVWEKIVEWEQKTPNDFDLFSYKIMYYMMKEEYEKAFLIAKEAVEKNPFSIEANYNLADVARIQREYVLAYQSLLNVDFFQKRANLFLISSHQIEEEIEGLKRLAREDESLEMEFYLAEQLHQHACHDPFKTSGDICGKIITTHDHKNYYLGCAENLLDSYFDLGGKRDAYHAKCEAYEIESISNQHEICTNEKELVPVCVNYRLDDQERNSLWEKGKQEQTLYQENARGKYSYIPLDRDTTLLSDKEMLFAKPIPLEQKKDKKHKRLVLGIFIDSINNCIFRKYPLQEIMPETYRFFSKGLICQEFYSGSEWTLPSMASYWTGKISSHHMNLDENFRFDFMKQGKVLPEYFEENGYVTAHIGGNDAATLTQGYNRGIIRTIYQNDYRTKNMVADALQHLETFRETNQFLLLSMEDLHDVAGGFMRSLKVQSETPLQDRKIDNRIETTVKQSYSRNREKIYIRDLKEMDFWLGQLYHYIEENYEDDEIIITLFSDHGTAFNVANEKAFLSEDRVNVPFFIRGGNVPVGTTDEIMQNVDFGAIMCKLAGIEYRYEKSDANLPVVFGGNNQREYAFSQTIFPRDLYLAALHGSDFHYYFETRKPVSPEYQIDIEGAQGVLFSKEGERIRDKVREEKYKRTVLQQIAHLIKVG